MSRLVRNIFFFIGLAAIGWMVYSFDLTWGKLVELLKVGGVYFPLVLLLWVGIYAVNTFSWQQIIKSQGAVSIPWLKLYKFTVSGFALNYVTPGGLNGGEPYRILELKQYLGVTRASSSTILYSIVHIGSHLIFWALGAVLMLFMPIGQPYTGWLILVLVISLLALILFRCLMHKGVAYLLTLLLTKIPGLSNYIKSFEVKYRETILLIDKEVREVYSSKKHYFFSALGLELVARLIGCFEISLLMIPLMGYSDFILSYLIIAIASLMGNLLFFMPMQLGGREGGFTLALSMLGLSASYGLVVSLLVRLRELFWILIGILLIQLTSGSKSIKKDS